MPRNSSTRRNRAISAQTITVGTDDGLHQPKLWLMFQLFPDRRLLTQVRARIEVTEVKLGADTVQWEQLEHNVKEAILAYLNLGKLNTTMIRADMIVQEP